MGGYQKGAELHAPWWHRLKPEHRTCTCRELLSYTKTAVTRNQGEKKINSLLDHVSTSSNMRLLQVGSAIVPMSCSCQATKEQLGLCWMCFTRCTTVVHNSDGSCCPIRAGVLCHHT